MQTCRHFRFQVPQEIADELRGSDPEPCELCDSLQEVGKSFVTAVRLARRGIAQCDSQVAEALRTESISRSGSFGERF
jgi:hypothetical protein